MDRSVIPAGAVIVQNQVICTVHLGLFRKNLFDFPACFRIGTVPEDVVDSLHHHFNTGLEDYK